MACRKAGLRDDRKHRNPPAAPAAVSDALLFATMCIINMPVEVHVSDGSVYSGIFHTASVPNHYAVVLKQARMIKKGSRVSNVVEGSFVETLVIQPDDLVQVVAKGVLLPSIGMAGFSGDDGIGAIGSNGREVSLDKEANVVKSNGPKVNKRNKNNSRHLARKENDLPDTSADKASSVKAIPTEKNNVRLNTTQSRKVAVGITSVDRRKAGHGSFEIHNDNRTVARDERTMLEVQGSNVNVAGCVTQSIAAVNIPVEKNVREVPHGLSGCSTSLEQQVRVNSISDKPSNVASSPTDNPISTRPAFNANTVSGLSASSNSFLPIPTKNSSIKRTVKESKLNPGAKMFSPLLQKPGTTPLVPKGGNVYMSDTHTMSPIAAEREADPIALSRSSPPVKFVSCNNVASGNGGNDYAPYVQHITGQMVSRTQPIRYAGQYNNIQTAPTYIQPNPQSVMHGGRVNPVVYMHPISSDIVRTETVFSPASPRPLLNLHQMHLPKHQGNAPAQALQLCMSPPVIASGAQPYMMTSPHPVSQPVFPVLRPLAVPGSNMFTSTKFG